ncbi:phosphoglucosamine mutase [Clostridium aminobutyricum]|uniref:Phosphoglucosamine mutase n=1 Tax=Clostridium aminobutyricum TaxID=33953 RepID=A0A939D9G0_CLOAM|nr:phosphoglucosamine mutase [Clostridium aminobutyricum]MBN7773854.1 phosphoglucosamine mutase [Clostridium aminobutyricum]
MGRLFGTDGVRGIANSELTPELAFNLGKAGAYVLSKKEQRPVVLIGKDTRISGDMLEDAISAGILAMGGNVIKVGVLPTPAVAYLVRHYKATAGVVISASHNTFEYNGIKFFNGEGFKLDDTLEEEIEDIIIRNIDVNSHITGDKLGRCLEAEEDALELYAKFLESTIDVSLKGMKIVLDCANGASYKVAERVFYDLGAEITVLAKQPNGININDACGSTHPEKLQKIVVEKGAAIGLAFDGDADRLIAVDEQGRIIDGDKTILMCAKMLKESGLLVNNLVTATVMSNLGFHKGVEAMGAKVEVTAVGDRYVLESMLKSGGIIGGEQSGHIIFLNYTTTGDGILSALQLLKAIKLSGKKPSELSDEITIYPQVLKNAAIKNENKKNYMEDTEISAEIKRVEELMAGEGRVLIRPSGTEPLVRVMIEGKDIETIAKLAQDLALLITKRLG